MRAVSSSICISKSCSVEDISSFPDLLLLRSVSVEDRSQATLSAISDPRAVWEFEAGNDDFIEFSCQEMSHTFGLKSNQSVSDFGRAVANRHVIIDITGFEHSHWAWLVKASLLSPCAALGAIYCEPETYTFSDNPVGGEFFQLSERIRGIEPLPGFAALNPRLENFIFVPMLGFEGPRFSYMMEEVQPNQVLTYPILGVPGFQVEFPFFAIQGNRRILLNEEHLWGNRRMAKANCPSSVFSVLESIHREHSDKLMRIAPIGTKPHALGAVLYKIANENTVDIVYDHPIRKAGRTSGYSNLLYYNLDLFR